MFTKSIIFILLACTICIPQALFGKELRPSLSAQNIYEEGLELINEKKFSEAIPIIEESYNAFSSEENNEGAAKALMALGYINEHSDKPGAAVIYYLQAINLGPDLYHKLSAYKNIGKIYKQMMLFDEAEFYYSKALSISLAYDQNEQAGINYNLGNLFRKQGQLDEAKAKYQEALRLTDESDVKRLNRIHNMLGLCFKDLGQYSEARSYYEYVIQNSTDSKYIGRSYHNIAWTWNEQNEFEKAIQFGLKALDFKTGSHRIITLIDLGTTYLNIGDQEQAIKCWNEAIQIGISPNKHEEYVVYQYLSQTYINDLEKSRMYLMSYADFLKKNNDQLDNLEQVFKSVRFKEEIEQYRKLVQEKEQRDKNLKWGIACVIMLILTCVIWLIYTKWKKRDTENAIMEVVKDSKLDF